MEEKKIEVYPIHHRNLIFNVITHLDLSFQEVREMLDYLMEHQAFQDTGEQWEEAQLYSFSLGNVKYDVDVSGYSVIVYRRDERLFP